MYHQTDFEQIFFFIFGFLDYIDCVYLSVTWMVEESGRYVCGVCGNVYKHGQSLWKHRKFECNTVPSFACPHCPYQAKRKHHLELHITRKHQSHATHR